MILIKILTAIILTMTMLFPTSCSVRAEPSFSVKAKETENYYYTQLSEDGKKAYSVIYKGVMNHDAKIEVAGISKDDVKMALDVVRNYVPEAYHIKETTLTSQKNRRHCIIEPIYMVTKSEHEKQVADSLAVVDKIIADMPEYKTEMEIVKYYHDYITTNYDYALNTELANGGYLPDILGTKMNCDVMSFVFQFLCDKSGIEAIRVLGEKSNTSHAWNLVKIDDVYYSLDLTVDVAFYKSASKNFKNCTTPIPTIGFLLTDAQLGKRYVSSDKYKLPTCETEWQKMITDITGLKAAIKSFTYNKNAKVLQLLMTAEMSKHFEDNYNSLASGASKVYFSPLGAYVIK